MSGERRRRERGKGMREVIWLEVVSLLSSFSLTHFPTLYPDPDRERACWERERETV